jgi:hypothetical protein
VYLLLAGNKTTNGGRMMVEEDLEKIRADKLAAISAKMNEVKDEVKDLQAMQNEFTWSDFGFDEPEWAFRDSEEMSGAMEICQRGQTVAITGDPRWALLVTDLLNRAKLEELILSERGDSASKNVKVVE